MQLHFLPSKNVVLERKKMVSAKKYSPLHKSIQWNESYGILEFFFSRVITRERKRVEVSVFHYSVFALILLTNDCARKFLN